MRRVRPRVLAVAAALASLCLIAGSAPVAAQADPDPAGTPGSTGPTGAASRRDPPIAGLVAYLTADGGVSVGTGAGVSVPVGDGAALDDRGVGTVRISPRGDRVAWVRNDLAIAVNSVDGGTPTVVATDAAVDAVGTGRSLAWSPDGNRIAYLAQGGGRNLVKVAFLDGRPAETRLDQQGRTATALTWSLVEDYGVIESRIPGTDRRFTLMAASASVGFASPLPTVADEPAFAPDGSFVVASIPAPGGQDLARVSAYSFQTTSIATSERICNPSVSPDTTRIVYAAGRDCDRLFLVPSSGGVPVDITPQGSAGSRWDAGPLEWTVDGEHITHADCRFDGNRVSCAGPAWFIRADGGGSTRGQTAGVIVPQRRPRSVDPVVVLDLAGARTDRISLPVVAASDADLLRFANDSRAIDATFGDGKRRLRVQLVTGSASGYVSGTLTFDDPATGENRSVNLIGNTLAFGARVVAIRGVWFSSAELPALSGTFTLSIRREP